MGRERDMLEWPSMPTKQFKLSANAILVGDADAAMRRFRSAKRGARNLPKGKLIAVGRPGLPNAKLELPRGRNERCKNETRHQFVVEPF